MIGTAKRNINTKIDWDALDGCWAEQYEKDYGNLFFSMNSNNRKINISVSSEPRSETKYYPELVSS